jgi:hypothetical protein
MPAVFAPAGTAVALPKIVGTAVPASAPGLLTVPVLTAQEGSELLALGAEVDAKLEAYRAAADALAAARATAKELWPPVPVELIVPFERVASDFYVGCYERETDFEGNEVWPEPYRQDGEWFGLPPSQVLQSHSLEDFLADVRSDPDCYEDRVTAALETRIDAAKRYEAARAGAIETSGIVEAKQGAEALALHSLLFEVRKHAPRSITGVLIMASAVMAFEEAQKESQSGGERAGRLILGRELADAIVRIGAKI